MSLINNIKDKINANKQYKEVVELYKKEVVELYKKDIADALRNSDNYSKQFDVLSDINNSSNKEQIINELYQEKNPTYCKYLKDCVAAGTFDNVLRKAEEDFKHWTLRAKDLQEEIHLLRPDTKEDIAERENIGNSAAALISSLDLNDKYKLRFHATKLNVAHQIINSGGLIAVEDRTGHAINTTNGKNEISVSDIHNIQYSLNYWMDLHSDVNHCLPAGCMFVLQPQNKREAEMIEHRQMNNVLFDKHPEQLVGILTTSENIPKVSAWLKENGLREDLVCTPKEFADKFELVKNNLKTFEKERDNYFNLSGAPDVVERPTESEKTISIARNKEQDEIAV